MLLYAIPWAVSLVMSVTVVLVTENRSPWLVLVIGVSIAVSFIVQTIAAKRERFISRLAIGIAGSVAIVFVAEAVALILR
ncbi:MAG: hypothetical protein ACTJFR_05040 [Canibacter sp.]